MFLEVAKKVHSTKNDEPQTPIPNNEEERKKKEREKSNNEKRAHNEKRTTNNAKQTTNELRYLPREIAVVMGATAVTNA